MYFEYLLTSTGLSLGGSTDVRLLRLLIAQDTFIELKDSEKSQ
jgi:hypothetical protein